LATTRPGWAFNFHRSNNGGTPTLRNGTPLTSSANFLEGSAPEQPRLRALVGGVEQPASASFTLPANAPPAQQYLTIPLLIPAGAGGFLFTTGGERRSHGNSSSPVASH
jgi:hypothetical protein